MKNEPIEEREPQGDGVFKIRKGNNSEKLIQIWFNCTGTYVRECAPDNETVTFIKTSLGNKEGFNVRLGGHLTKIINMPVDTYGWYRRFTENEGDIIHFQKV